jgi:1,4-alpha-glucan branching enzyme
MGWPEVKKPSGGHRVPLERRKVLMKATKPTRRAGSRNGTAVRLEVYQPDAIDVCVAGSFNDWQPQATHLVPLGNGKWSKELTLPCGRYEYRFIVDGAWITDPNAKELAPNPFGSENSVLTVEARG